MKVLDISPYYLEKMVLTMGSTLKRNNDELSALNFSLLSQEKKGATFYKRIEATRKAMEYAAQLYLIF